jgi:hypothetical protein
LLTADCVKFIRRTISQTLPTPQNAEKISFFGLGLDRTCALGYDIDNLDLIYGMELKQRFNFEHSGG